MARISISYRRSDSAGITGRIFDRLVIHYGRDAVFRDIEGLPAGLDYRQYYNEVLLKSNVLLAIVGTEWLGMASGGGERINEEADPVRVEIETALRRRIPMIPILIGDARMPSADHLPPSLKDFAFRTAVKVDIGHDFDHHMERLIKSIDAILGQTGQVPKSPPSREARIESTPPAPRPPSRSEKSAAATVKDAARRNASGTRPAAPATLLTSAADEPGKPNPRALVPYDWHEKVWPKTTQGRIWRLAGVGAVALAVIAIFILNGLFGGSTPEDLRLVRSFTNPSPVSALAFTSDARLLAAASLDKSVTIWSVSERRLLRTLRDSDGVSSVAFMPSGIDLISGTLNGVVLIRDALNDQMIRSFKPDVTYAWELPPAVLAVAVSPDGTLIASGNADGSVKLWNAGGGMLRSLAAHSDAVTAVAFGATGLTMVSGSKDGSVRAWDGGGRLLWSGLRSGQILTAAMSPNGRWVAAGGSGHAVSIWNATTGAIARTLQSRFGTVESLAFSHDGNWLAVGGDDAPIETWNVDSGGRSQTLPGHSRGVHGLAFAPNGSNQLASGGDDRTIDIWAAE